MSEINEEEFSWDEPCTLVVPRAVAMMLEIVRKEQESVPLKNEGDTIAYTLMTIKDLVSRQFGSGNYILKEFARRGVLSPEYKRWVDENVKENKQVDSSRIATIEEADVQDGWFFRYAFLEMSLKREMEKYRYLPPQEDMVPQATLANSWGYVVAAYNLLEMGLKEVRYARAWLNGKAEETEFSPKTHSLYLLYKELIPHDKIVLDEQYSNYIAAHPEFVQAHDDLLRRYIKKRRTSVNTLEGFLGNLDGEKGKGPFDWRYFLRERGMGDYGKDVYEEKMPFVCIELMHVIIGGLLFLILNIYKRSGVAEQNHV